MSDKGVRLDSSDDDQPVQPLEISRFLPTGLGQRFDIRCGEVPTAAEFSAASQRLFLWKLLTRLLNMLLSLVTLEFLGVCTDVPTAAEWVASEQLVGPSNIPSGLSYPCFLQLLPTPGTS